MLEIYTWYMHVQASFKELLATVCWGKIWIRVMLAV